MPVFSMSFLSYPSCDVVPIEVAAEVEECIISVSFIGPIVLSGILRYCDLTPLVGWTAVEMVIEHRCSDAVQILAK
jgi:hypothetical protein